MPPIWRLWSVGKGLLTKIDNLDERMALARDVFGRLSSLSAKWALLMTVVGYKSEREENVLVSKEDLDALAEDLREQVVSSVRRQSIVDHVGV